MSTRHWLPFAIAIGFLVLSRLLASVMTGAADIISTSVVLITSVVGIVAIAEAVWGIIEQAETALDERRHTHHRLTSGGSHR
ncbi:MAG TPA: hypothetical protein VJL35_11655 [Gemmatimonadaceae bacterium]|jgi:hypothetical protein|nr:hypothetical protein [Gemmatimonadaceae bacterium]